MPLDELSDTNVHAVTTYWRRVHRHQERLRKIAQRLERMMKRMIAASERGDVQLVEAIRQEIDAFMRRVLISGPIGTLPSPGPPSERAG
jgi:hypothetical protein